MSMNYWQNDLSEEVSSIHNIDTEEPSKEELEEIEAEEKEILKETLDYSCFESFNTFRSYCDEAKKFPLLTNEEELELAKEKDAGNEQARQALIEHNLCLVIKLAVRYAKSRGLDVNDLIEDGNLGLIYAVQKFDYNKGFRFSTYATWWIRQTILRGISNTSRTIRIPVHSCTKLSKITHAESEFTRKNSRKPTLFELSEETGFSMEEIDHLRLFTTVVSLSLPVNSEDDESSELGDFLTDETFDTEKIFEQKDLATNLRYYLKKTVKNARSLQIILMRYGLGKDSDSAMTLEEIGKNLGLTRERVRQLESKALRELRNSKEFRKKFKDYN